MSKLTAQEIEVCLNRISRGIGSQYESTVETAFDALEQLENHLKAIPDGQESGQ